MYLAKCIKSKRNVSFSESDRISLIQSDKDNLFIYREEEGHSETQYYKSFLDWPVANGEAENKPQAPKNKLQL